MRIESNPQVGDSFQRPELNESVPLHAGRNLGTISQADSMQLQSTNIGRLAQNYPMPDLGISGADHVPLARNAANNKHDHHDYKHHDRKPAHPADRKEFNKLAGLTHERKEHLGFNDRESLGEQLNPRPGFNKSEPLPDFEAKTPLGYNEHPSEATGYNKFDPTVDAGQKSLLTRIENWFRPSQPEKILNSENPAAC